MRQVRTLPDFSVTTKPLSSRICRCCTTAAKVISNGSAKADTDTGPTVKAFRESRAGRIAECVKDSLDVRLFPHEPAHVISKPIKQFPPSVFAHSRAIGAFKEGGLMGEDQIGPFVGLQ